MCRNGPEKVFLIRHGRSAWNGENRVTGQLDPPLSPEGARQAEILEHVLRGECLSAVYTSPLTRARETAEPAARAHELSIQVRDELMEIHMGVLQGRFRDYRDPEAQHLWQERERDRLHYRVPEGESFLDLERRVLPCLHQVLETEKGAVLIVGHNGTNRVILGALMRWPREVAVGMSMKSKFLYEISPRDVPRIRTICLDESKIGRVIDGFRS
jgi:alpha-ribazole phosphatase